MTTTMPSSEMTVALAYETLEIRSANATLNEVKAAYRRLSREKHPDKNINDPTAKETFMEIKRAYKYLLDLSRYNLLNAEHKPTLQQPPPNEFTITLTLEELFYGGHRTETILRKIVDENGAKQLEKVSLPLYIVPGTASGTRLVVHEVGDILPNYQIPANVVIIVLEAPHSQFKRVRFDLEYIREIKAEDACGKVALLIPTIENEPIRLDLDELVTPNTVKVIPNRGMPIPNSRGRRGSLTVRFKIKFDIQDASIRIDLHLTLDQIYFGHLELFQFNRSITDLTGEQQTEIVTLPVQIKPGIRTGATITLPKAGHRKPGVIPGDIIFTICEKPQMYFKRAGANVEYLAVVARSQKNLSYEVEVFGNQKISFILSDDVFEKNASKVFNGRGLPMEHDESAFGNLIIKFYVVDSVDPPIEFDLLLTLKNLLSGCTKRRKIIRKIVHSDGREESDDKILTIKVKPGTVSGTRYIFPREGDQTYLKSVPSDVIFTVRIKPHELFQQNGVHLGYIAKVTERDFAESKVVEIPTLDDCQLECPLGDIVNPTTAVKRFAGFGLPYVSDLSNKRGDLIVRFQIIEDLQDPPVLVDLLLTPEQMRQGCTKTMRINRTIVLENGSELCEITNLNVVVKADSKVGNKITFQQAGDQRVGRVPADVIFLLKEKPKDPPVVQELAVTLENIFSGASFEKVITRKIVHNNGTEKLVHDILNIQVKPGVSAGTRLVFPEMCDQYPKRTPGDLIFVVKEVPHVVFARDGDVDLRYTAKIYLSELATVSANCPYALIVPTIDGESIHLFLEEREINHGEVNVIPEQGLPYMDDPSKRGNLLVKVEIVCDGADEELILTDSSSDESEAEFVEDLEGGAESKSKSQFNSQTTTVNQNVEEQIDGRLHTESNFQAPNASERIVEREIPATADAAEQPNVITEHELPLTLEQIVQGCTVTRELAQSGPVDIEINPRTPVGTKILLPGHCDVVFVVTAKQHDLFKRIGEDIEYNCSISESNLLNGAIAQIPTLTGNLIQVKLNESMRRHSFYSIIGQGLPIAEGTARRGKMIVKFTVIKKEKDDSGNKFTFRKMSQFLNKFL